MLPGLVSGREVVLSGTTQGWDLNQHALTASTEAQKVRGIHKCFPYINPFTGCSIRDVMKARYFEIKGEEKGNRLFNVVRGKFDVLFQITGRKTFVSMVFFSGKFDMMKGLVVRSSPKDDPLHIDLRSFIQALALGPSDIHINSLTIKGELHMSSEVIHHGFLYLL